MEKKTLSSLLEGKIFQIPDYQRGYAWEEKQWKDFVQDIDALIDDKIINHYTGTIVIYQNQNRSPENYGTKKFENVDIIDGQQRLTTCSLYLSIILNELIKLGEKEFESEIPIYLYSGAKCKLNPNNETSDFYFDLISKGVTNIQPKTVHQKRLIEGYNYLKTHIKEQLQKRENSANDYLHDLFDAIIRKLNFSYYPIEVESEIGMTFELMNSRGKDLSYLELLKNYLMYWVYRNITDNSDKEDTTKLINKSFKEVYANIALSKGNEDQCLRIAWTLYHSYTPKNWTGYNGFKADDVIPIRDFSKKSKEDTKKFICEFVNGLAEISKHYSEIINPHIETCSNGEFIWLSKIKNVGTIASFLPLMVASRIKVVKGNLSLEEYVNLLKALELYSYRVFLWAGKRSNTGNSNFYRWADEVFKEKTSISEITNRVYGILNYYSDEGAFRKELEFEFFDWYYYRRLLKYTLYEYELWLLFEEGKGNNPKLNWEDLSDSTIEHILPQNPDKSTNWMKIWNKDDYKRYIHDISNLVLTKDNSHYLNFEFNRKKGKPGIGYCYSNSDIRQERKIAEYDIWNVEKCQERRVKLVDWIINRWGVDKNYIVPDLDELDEENDIE